MKTKDFMIAEVLAVVSFILNTILVFAGKETHAPFSAIWLPSFGLVYWIKTLLALAGLYYFFKAKAFSSQEIPRFISIIVFVVLLYSIPGINMILFGPALSIFFDRNDVRMTYQARIPAQMIWAIPAFVCLIDMLLRLLKQDKNK
ncbi:MAG: hypothetical protein AB1481_01195 [Candidatus Omnitrophota bacterium]